MAQDVLNLRERRKEVEAVRLGPAETLVAVPLAR